MQKLTAECTRYLSLVHGMRDYLLHVQAALEIELEAATKREAKEAELAAIAAAESLRRQQEAEQAAKRKAEQDAERRRIEEAEKAVHMVSAAETNTDKADKAQNAEGEKEGEALAEPAIASRVESATSSTETQIEESSTTKQQDAGNAANVVTVIDSDGDDEDDVPLAFVPKTGAAEGDPIDLTDSPALANAAKPVSSDAAAVTTAAPQDPTSTSTVVAPTSGTAASAGIPGLDLSALGIDVSSLGNLSDLSSLGIPSLANSTISTAEGPNALAPATDFSELEKMMGIDLASSAASANPPTVSIDASSSDAPDLSSLGSFNLGGATGGFGEDTNMFGSSSGGLDLSNFDFSSLSAGADPGMGADGGVDLSSFLTNFTSSAGAGDDTNKNVDLSA